MRSKVAKAFQIKLFSKKWWKLHFLIFLKIIKFGGLKCWKSAQLWGKWSFTSKKQLTHFFAQLESCQTVEFIIVTIRRRKVGNLHSLFKQHLHSLFFFPPLKNEISFFLRCLSSKQCAVCDFPSTCFFCTLLSWILFRPKVKERRYILQLFIFFSLSFWIVRVYHFLKPPACFNWKFRLILVGDTIF